MDVVVIELLEVHLEWQGQNTGSLAASRTIFRRRCSTKRKGLDIDHEPSKIGFQKVSFQQWCPENDVDW